MNKKIMILMLTLIMIVSTVFATNQGELCYSMDNDTISLPTIYDIADGKHNATVTGATPGYPGILVDSISCDGISDYIEPDYNPDIQFESNWSISLWFNTSSTTLYGNVYGEYTSATDYFFLTVNYIKPGNTVMYVDSTTGVDEINFTNTTMYDGNWHMLTFTKENSYNVTDWKFYLDGALQNIEYRQDLATNYPISKNPYICAQRRPTPVNYWEADIDQFQIWNATLRQFNVTELYNGGTGLNNCIPPPSAPTNITFYFMNISNAWNFSANKTLFNEGENFYSYLNWSNSTDQINGECNITVNGSISERELTDQDILLCSGAGCDGSTYLEQITQQNNNTITKDFVHFHACHISLASRDLTVSIDCNGSSITESQTIVAIEIPTCTLGAIDYFVELNACNNFTDINVTFSNSAPILNQGHNITGSAFDREFTNYLHIFNETVFRNSSNGIYYINHSHEYYEHGIKGYFAECNNATLGISKSETKFITIVNQPPQVFYDVVRTPCNQTNLTNNVQIDYCDGQWNFSVIIIDDDADKINATLMCQLPNGTYSIFDQKYGNVTPGLNFTINGSVFVDFVDPQNNQLNCTAEIFVNDTEGLNVTAYLNFSVVDIINPVCLNITNATINNASIYNWDVQCYDEHFYSFNITCSGGSVFNFSKININATSYNFTNSTTINGNTSCFIKYCDGHTSTKLKRLNDPSYHSNGMRFNVNNQAYDINYTGAYDVIMTAKRLHDRYSWTMINNNPSQGIKTYFFRISTEQGRYIQSTEYPGWIVDYNNEVWIDFNNNDPDSNVIVTPTGAGFFNVRVLTKLNNLTFNSIGELNCKNVTQIINIAPINISINQTFQVAECPDSVPSALMFGIIVVIALVFIVIAVFSKVKIIGTLGSIMLIFFSYSITGCSEGLGFVLLGSGVILTLFFILAQYFTLKGR